MEKTIMVVDDDPKILISVKEGIEDADNKFRIITAESGQHCLTLLKTNIIPDLILLDIMMPEMSGWALYDKLKENKHWKKIPIIFLTARTDRVARNVGSFLGEDYIEKPFDIPQIITRINDVLEVK